MPRLRRKAIGRQRLNRSKIRQLLCGFDAFHRGAHGYGNTENRTDVVDVEAARRDWENCKAFLMPEFERLNPDRVCWAAHQFDGVKLPDGQDSFWHLNTRAIQNQFPA